MARHARHARVVRGEQRDARLRSDGLSSARASTTASPAASTHSRRSRRRSTSTSTRLRSTRIVKVDLGIVGDCAHVLEDMVRLWRTGSHRADQAALAKWWSAIDGWRARKSFGFRNSDRIIKPQHAVQRLYELTRGRDVYHHHRGRPAPDVGRAAFPLRGAEPLDDLRRSRHHGLRPAGGDRRADGASERAGRSTSPARPRS